MAVTGAVVAVVGLGVAVDVSKTQAREGVRQKRATRAVEFSRQQRERRAALRERRIRIGQLNVAAQATGVAESSGELATEAAIATNFAVNVGFGNQLQAARNVIGASQIRTAKSKVRGAVGGAIQGIGANIFQLGGGFESIFGPSTVGGQVEAVLNTEGLF